MEKIPLEEFLIYLILESYVSVLTHQKLIDKWNNPQDPIVRATTIIRDIHSMNGRAIYSIYKRYLDGEFLIKKNTKDKILKVARKN